MAELPAGVIPLKKPPNILSTVDRKAAYHMLLGMSRDGVLERGSVTIVASVFSVDKSTISRLWRQVRLKSLNNHNDDDDDSENGEIYASDAYKRRKGKYLHDRDELKAAVMALPKSRRKRYRWLAANDTGSIPTVT